jgi:hypothetical protein
MTNLHRTHLIVAVAMLGAANAVLRPVAVMIADQGAVDAALGGFGVNPAVWVALILAGWGLADPYVRILDFPAGCLCVLGKGNDRMLHQEVKT